MKSWRPIFIYFKSYWWGCSYRQYFFAVKYFSVSFALNVDLRLQSFLDFELQPDGTFVNVITLAGVPVATYTLTATAGNPPYVDVLADVTGSGDCATTYTPYDCAQDGANCQRTNAASLNHPSIGLTLWLVLCILMGVSRAE